MACAHSRLATCSRLPAVDQVRVEPAPCRLRVQYSVTRPLHPLVCVMFCFCVSEWTGRTKACRHHCTARGDCRRPPFPSTRQRPSYGDCLEVKREYHQNCSVLDCVTQCSQSTAHLYEQFLQIQQIGFVTLGLLRRS